MNGWRGVMLVLGQASSSAGNFAVAVLVARTAGVDEFAAFALAFPLYSLAAQFVRVAQPVPRQVRCAIGEADLDTVEPLVPTLHMAALLLGLGACAWLFAGSLGTWILAVTLATLPALVYDVMRNELIVRSSERHVAAYDLAWLFGQFLLVAMIHVAGIPSGLAMLAAWAAPPVVLAPLMWLGLQRPRLTSVTRARASWSARVDGVVDLMGSVVVLQAVPYVVLALAGTSAAAGFRAGQMLLGPANVLVAGLGPLLQRSVARNRDDGRRVRRLVVQHTVRILALSVPYGCMFAVLSDDLGEELLGETWQATAPMMTGLVLLMIARVPFGSISVALRSLQAQGVLSRQRLLAYALLLLGAVAGSLADDVAVLPLCLAVAATVTAALGWRSLVGVLARRSAVPAGATR